MILLDTDVLLLELRYVNDPRGPVNRNALQRIQNRGIPLACTTQTLLEVVGVLSFSTSQAQIPRLPLQIAQSFRVTILPDPGERKRLGFGAYSSRYAPGSEQAGQAPNVAWNAPPSNSRKTPEKRK